MATTLASIAEEHRFSKLSCAPLEHEPIAPPMMTIGPIRLEDMFAPEETPMFSWDLREVGVPVLSALQYISKRLAQQDVHVALIVTSHIPELIPVWPINAHAQNLLSRVVRKASKKYDISPQWLKSLTDICRAIPPAFAFDSHRTMSYLVHRTLVQHEIVFSGEGLTLLAADSIYLFKSLLNILSKPDWLPMSRMQCKDSCVHLLHHVHSVYTGTKLSKGYLTRAYQHIGLDEDVLSEVCEAYRQTYGKTGLAEMSKCRTSKQDPKEETRPTEISQPSSQKTRVEYMASRRATEPTVIASRTPKPANSNRPIAPGNLPKLTTANLDMVAVNLESAESFYFPSTSKAQGRSSADRCQSARPSEWSRTSEQARKQPQSAHLRSSSRLCDSSPTVTQSPLGIIGLPIETPITVIDNRKPTATSSWVASSGPSSDVSSSNTSQIKVPQNLKSRSSCSSISSPRFSSASSNFSDRSYVGLPSNPRDTPLLNLRNVQSDSLCSRCKLGSVTGLPSRHEEMSRLEWQSAIRPSAPRELTSHESILFG